MKKITPLEQDKRHKRSFNLKAGMATFLLYCNLSVQAYHDDFREEAQRDPDETCSSYYTQNRAKVLDQHIGKGYEDEKKYVLDCSEAIRNIPEESALSNFFGKLALGATGLSIFSLMGWRNHRKKYPELSNPSSNDPE